MRKRCMTVHKHIHTQIQINLRIHTTYKHIFMRKNVHVIQKRRIVCTCAQCTTLCH